MYSSHLGVLVVLNGSSVLLLFPMFLLEFSSHYRSIMDHLTFFYYPLCSGLFPILIIDIVMDMYYRCPSFSPGKIYRYLEFFVGPFIL